MKAKTIFLSFLLFVLMGTFVFADYVGKVYFIHPDKAKSKKTFSPAPQTFKNYFDVEIQRGNLIPLKVQIDPISKMEHHRYVQQFKGLPVFGGEIIYHLKNGNVESINGEYYTIKDLDIQPVLTWEEAVEIFRKYLGEQGLEEKAEDSLLVIYPAEDGDFFLAYQITLNKENYYSMTGIIDAKTGGILLNFSNIHFDEPGIGLGVGYHGSSFKMATTLNSDGYFYVFDEKRIRPYNHYTYDYRTGYIPGDGDNYWDFDGTLVSGHVFVGFVYDFFYGFFNRKGIDDNNMNTIVYVHNTKYSDNAYWSGSEKSINFCDPKKSNSQFAAALDVVAHEYAHGVTDYSSGLIYSFEPGALNESFSDIMGATAEFYWFPEGHGLHRADWYIGEDATPSYKTSGCRNLADPNSNSQLGDPRYPDPCHLSQKIICSYDLDNGGVHLNMTIYSHAFYLLAQGGTNRVSGIYVNGIGLEKAAKIFYRTWVYYLTKTSKFVDAANALLQVAYNDYGANSTEYQQTIRSVEAIGWIIQ